METSKLSFGQKRLILTIAKYYDLCFDDISIQECNSLKEFSEICESILKDQAECYIRSSDLDPYEKEILIDYYYNNFFSIWGSDSEDFPYILYSEEYKLMIEIPTEYYYKAEKEIDTDTRLLSIEHFAHIYKLNCNKNY